MQLGFCGPSGFVNLWGSVLCGAGLEFMQLMRPMRLWGFECWQPMQCSFSAYAIYAIYAIMQPMQTAWPKNHKNCIKLQCGVMRFNFLHYAAHGVYAAMDLDFMQPIGYSFAVEFETQAA